MTKEEKAIDTLFYFKMHFAKSDICREHFDMAIKALESQLCEDCISRQEALKYSHIEYDDDGIGHRVIYAEDIEKLPPVTPSYNSINTELKPCEDCVIRDVVI